MWTLMLLKPDLVSHPVLLKATFKEIVEVGVKIGGAARMRLSRAQAEELYKSHQGKFFYPRLVRHVTSGPVIALRVSGDVRRILGSSKLWPLPESATAHTLRQRLALSDVRNVAHTSDDDVAERELALFQFDESITDVELLRE